MINEQLNAIAHLEYWIGDIVYLKTDSDQAARMVTSICISEKGVEVQLSYGTQKTWHQTMEISTVKDVIKATTE